MPPTKLIKFVREFSFLMVELYKLGNRVLRAVESILPIHDRIRGSTRYGTMLDGGSKETVDNELDDEYLPSCCRNGRPHSHPV